MSSQDASAATPASTSSTASSTPSTAPATATVASSSSSSSAAASVPPPSSSVSTATAASTSASNKSSSTTATAAAAASSTSTPATTGAATATTATYSSTSPHATAFYLNPTPLVNELGESLARTYRQNIPVSNYAKSRFDGGHYPGHSHYPQMEQEQTFLNRSLPYFRASRVITRDVLIHNLPSLRDVQYQDRPALLSRKIRLCCYQFSPSELLSQNPQHLREKELKRTTCQELAQYIHTSKPSLTEDQLSELFEMFEVNLFVSLPPQWVEQYDSNTVATTTSGLALAHSTELTSEESLALLDEHQWEHSQLIYDIVLKLANLTETEIRLLQRYFSPAFVLGLLDRFDSEQTRERDYLKTILHRIYGNFMQLRPFIRTAINHVFYRIIYDTDRFCGTSELLEILGSIINGFALPLKEQHKIFLMRVLLPMHKVSSIHSFLGQLTYCLTQFLDKDPTLCSHIVTAIVYYWPRTSCKKELLFLKELDDIIDKIQQPKFLTENAFRLVFEKLGQCISSPHFQISERALMVLHSEGTFRLLVHNRALALPPIIRSLHINTTVLKDDCASEIASHGAFLKNVSPNGIQMLSTARPLQFLDRQGPSWCPGSSTRLYGHWSPTISEVCSDVLKKFSDMDIEQCGQLSADFEQRSKHEPHRINQRAIAWRNVYQYAQHSGILDNYDCEEFHREQRRIAADPPTIVRKERKAGGGNPS